MSPPLCPQLLDSDQDLYKNFPLVISERWQQEVAETVYEAVNSDTDKTEARKRAKNKQLGHEEGNDDSRSEGRENRLQPLQLFFQRQLLTTSVSVQTTPWVRTA